MTLCLGCLVGDTLVVCVRGCGFCGVAFAFDGVVWVFTWFGCLSFGF